MSLFSSVMSEHEQEPVSISPSIDERAHQFVHQFETKGRIGLKVHSFSTLDITLRQSECVEIGGCQFTLAAQLSVPDYLGCYVRCNAGNQSSKWACKAEIVIGVKNYEGKKDITYQFTQDFTKKHEHQNWGSQKVAKKEELSKEDSGFIQHDIVSIEATIKILSFRGVNPKQIFTFSDDIDEVNDVLVELEGQKIAVSRSILSMYSPFFNALFFGRFKDSQESIISLGEVSYDDFISLLLVIYPSREPISTDNIDCLLHLSDKLDFPQVRRWCDEFVSNDSEIELQRKVLWADSYSLPRLQTKINSLINSVDTVKQIMKSDLYENHFTDGAKAFLLERIAKLIDKKD